MTNTVFSSIDECRDIEELNAYRQYVEEHSLVSADVMLRCINTVGRDNARTPMQWDDSANAGFTTGRPWIKVNPNYRTVNAKAALEDPDSVFRYYQKLIRLRHELPVIVYGMFRPLMEDSESIYAYERLLETQRLIVACNWTDTLQPCSLFERSGGRELISNYETHQKGMLAPYEARAVLYE